MRVATLFLCAFAAAAQVPLPPPLVPGGAKPAAAKAAPPRAGAAPTYRDLKYAARRAPQLPVVKRFQLANGMKLLLAEDHETPLIHGFAMVRTGSAFDPPGKAGLAAITGALLRGGGTREHSPEQLDDELDRLGASIDAGTGETMGSLAMVAWKPNLAATLAAFAEVLTSPAFRSDRLDLAKSATMSAIARRNDDPQQVMRRELLTALVGKESALTRRPEYTSVAAIERGDVAGFYRQYYVPANTLLVFSGDFETEAMRGALEALFSGWKPEAPPAPEFPKAAAAPPGGAYLASLPQARQSALALGRSGLTYRDSDAAALEVAAQVLQGRLRRRTGATADAAHELRVEAAPGVAYPGLFVVSGPLAGGSATDGVSAAVEELQKLRSAEASDDELRMAREAVWSRVCQGLDNKSTAARTIGTAEYYGLPADHLARYVQTAAAATRADVLRVAKERLDPAGFTLVLASNLRAFVDPRSGTPANRVDVTIPERAATATATAAAGSAESARKLLARAQQAAGGADKLAAVKDMTIKTSYKLARGGSDEEFDQWIAPATLRQDGTSTQFGRLVRFTDGTGGWISNGYNSGPLTGANLRQVAGDAMRHPISLLLSDRTAGRALRAVDDESIEIVQGDLSVRVAFDASTGLPSELAYEIPTDRQPLIVREKYSDYRNVNGIQLPFHVVTTQNGQKYAEGDVTEIKLNQGLKPEVLQRRP